ncbi:hypothetical protein ABH940_007236 [Streptacidiphilus sp. BW17]
MLGDASEVSADRDQGELIGTPAEPPRGDGVHSLTICRF